MALIPATLTAPPLPRRRQLLFGTAFAAVGVASKIHCASGAIRCQPKTRS